MVMSFFVAAEAASFPALVGYVLIVLFAHISRQRNFNHLALLGMASGLVIGEGLVGQFGLTEAAVKTVVIIGSVAAFLFLFNLVARRLPLKSAT
jgi:uncharacterized membrane protein YcaP (DUF421 family)